MRTLAGTVFSIVSFLVSVASATELAPNRDAIFASSEVLNVGLEAPFTDLFSKKDDWAVAKKFSLPGRLLVNGREVAVDVRLRGWSTLGTCAFPKLMLKFKKGAANGTVFEGIKKLDLNTHCEPQGTMASFFGSLRMNHREALAYHWAKILKVDAYGARMAQVKYRDTSASPSGKADVTAPGFFIEHLSSVLKRNQAVEIRPTDSGFDPRGSGDKSVKYIWNSLEDAPTLNREQLARVALFEALIGNSDWRMNASEIWNSKVIELPTGEWLTLPMDFNFSSLAQARSGGIQNWSYEAYAAWPQASLETRKKIFAEFMAAKPELIASVALLGEDKEGRDNALKIIEDKYKEFSETLQ